MSSYPGDRKRTKIMVVQAAILTYPAPAYGLAKKGREGINGVGKVRSGYIVKFPHPMYFPLRWAEERWPCAYATLFSPTKGKIHGVWKLNNITPSHLSHPVDTFSALLYI